MAAGLLRRLHGERIFVDSCGVDACEEVDGFTMTVMQELGIDLADHYPKALEEANGESFELIIALSPASLRRTLELTRNNSLEVLSWQTVDPSWREGSRDDRIQAYRSVRDALDQRIRTYFQA